MRLIWLGLLASLGSSLSLAQAPAAAEPPSPVYPDVPYVPTPDETVQKMLELAKVTKKDVVYDLGSGDGRIVIAAAQKGARATGVDIDPQRIEESKKNAKAAGLTDRVKFLNQNLFDTDLREATVVTLYLLPSVNLKLKPKLLRELPAGARIVSHSFDMGDWKPEKTAEVGGSTVYFWVVPERNEALKQAAAAEAALAPEGA